MTRDDFERALRKAIIATVEEQDKIDGGDDNSTLLISARVWADEKAEEIANRYWQPIEPPE